MKINALMKTDTVKMGAFSGEFMIATIAEKLASNGNPYLDVTLQDNTGTVPAKAFGVSMGFPPLMPGDIISVQGTVGEYRGARDVKLTKIKYVDLPPCRSLEEFVPSSPHPIDQMMCSLQCIIESVTDKSLERLLRVLVTHKDFERAPAAMKMHHAYLGGLLEHVVSLANAGCAMAGCYDLDRDIMIAAAIMHDIGKVHELTAIPTPSYTRAGRLRGHISLGMEMVSTADHFIALPAATREHLLHIIASHHGTRDKGALVVPATREAIVFHHLDMIDSRYWMVEQAADAATSEFAEFHRGLDVQVWRPAVAQAMDDMPVDLPDLSVSANDNADEPF